MLDALDAGLPSSTAWCPKRSDSEIQTLTRLNNGDGNETWMRAQLRVYFNLLKFYIYQFILIEFLIERL